LNECGGRQPCTFFFGPNVCGQGPAIGMRTLQHEIYPGAHLLFEPPNLRRNVAEQAISGPFSSPLCGLVCSLASEPISEQPVPIASDR
jgi:hypothetical protein